ncbi:MAG: MFS transporter [Planctomycetes bacterium]|nr:MFS transporter [Planctomycetota bacterium]
MALVALMLLVAVHFFVDFFASFVNPLWPVMERHLGLAENGALWIFVAWSIATSFGQFAFVIWARRGRGRWILWLGPALAMVGLSSLGLMGSAWGMAALVVCGGLGVAAFHPEAAARAGALVPSHRSRVMAVFSLGGCLGQAAGPYYAGAVTEDAGLIGLLTSILWGSALLLVLIVTWYATPARLMAPYRPSERHRADRRTGTTHMMWLLAVASLRVMPTMGVLVALAYLLDSQEVTLSRIGFVQSAYMIGIGGGGMTCALLVSQRWERPVMWLTPMFSALPLAFLAVVDGWWMVTAVGAAGFLHGIGMPVFISYGQQLLPTGERIANSITMGVCWGVASGLVAVAMRAFQWAEALPLIFVFFAVTSVTCGLLCLCLPHVDKPENHGRIPKDADSN